MSFYYIKKEGKNEELEELKEVKKKLASHFTINES